jgi:hypothetical protein
MVDWIKEEKKLHKDHTWAARPGCKIFVADHGALRFDYPQDWVFLPGENSFNFHDRQPPDDDIHLEVSILRLPPVDLSGLPVRNMIPAALAGDTRDIRSRGEIQEMRNGDLEFAWIESVFMDHQVGQDREAHSRLCLARGGNIQPIITMEFWPEDTVRACEAWDNVLGSLELGMHIEDPTRGHILH